MCLNGEHCLRPGQPTGHMEHQTLLACSTKVRDLMDCRPTNYLYDRTEQTVLVSSCLLAHLHPRQQVPVSLDLGWVPAFASSRSPRSAFLCGSIACHASIVFAPHELIFGGSLHASKVFLLPHDLILCGSFPLHASLLCILSHELIPCGFFACQNANSYPRVSTYPTD